MYTFLVKQMTLKSFFISLDNLPFLQSNVFDRLNSIKATVNLNIMNK